MSKVADEASWLSVGPSPPRSIDWRCFNGQNWVTDIRDQKTCGACVAFATWAVLESRAKWIQGNPNLSMDLSEAHLFFCGAGAACEKGWDIEGALEFCRNFGVGEEAQFPYKPKNLPCNQIEPMVKVSSWDCKFCSEARKKSFAENGPVIAGMQVFEDIYFYRSGIYRKVAGKFRRLHAVAVIGYDDQQKCWIVKNSWGTGWGEKGFMRIAYEELNTRFPFYAPFVTTMGRFSRRVPSGDKRYDNVHTLNEGHIVAPVHEPIEVKVKGHGATGYMWKVATNASKVRVVDHKFKPDLTAFGAGGEESFILGVASTLRTF